MRSAFVVVALLLAGCSAPSAPQMADQPTGLLQGLVLDPLLRPVPGATVAVGNHTVNIGDDGGFRMEANWSIGEHLVRFQAPGYVSETRVFVATTTHQQGSLNVTLGQITVGRLDVQQYRGLVACGAIVQVGHSHGNGDPDEDNHIDCAPGRGQQTFNLVAGDVDDLMLELRWDAQTRQAERMTMVLRNDAGVISFDEGVSPLRMHFGRDQVAQAFLDDVTIQILPGIPDDAPGEVYVGLQVEQPFEVFAVTGHGMDVPLDWVIGS